MIRHEEKASERVISAILRPARNGKRGIGLVKNGSIMLKNIKTSKFYRIKKEDVENSTIRHYNMLVVEDTDGDFQELLFTDLELEKSLIRRKCHDKIVPRYTTEYGSCIPNVVVVFICFLCLVLGYFINELNLL